MREKQQKSPKKRILLLLQKPQMSEYFAQNNLRACKNNLAKSRYFLQFGCSLALKLYWKSGKQDFLPKRGKVPGRHSPCGFSRLNYLKIGKVQAMLTKDFLNWHGFCNTYR
ncbi:hypothetical protein [Acidaminococcus sp. AM05-11]|uniref:hypothetical protein n=1 Tax=Acidaminococcus sp. AM05-11 TaxID=2291997 RepID=UPI0013147C05|nr:hypothetical protein [Acidaminococcus sp. AM05-11]